MPENDFFSLFTDHLNALSVEYMVTGSAVVVAYGEPRLTNDIDLVLSLTPKDVTGIIDVFPEHEYYCPPEEILLTEVGRSARGHFNIIHHETGLKADCYLAGRDAFQAWGLSHRQQLLLADHDVFFAPLEYVIIKKLQFYEEGESEKHLRDIRGLLSVSRELIDQEVLQKHIAAFKLEASWQKIAAD